MSVSSMDITLERPSGVYYAGEVVRGTVTLVTTDVVDCRGFFCRFRGRARAHWHTGSGDNRTDYDGQTLFQCQYQTLAGNFYRTPLLDEAGSEADFDVVANSGVLRIPCANIDEHQLQLILRLMDYDWGKRDDLLGEIVVDVPALLRSRSQQTYPLTRRGRPEKGQVTLSAKWLPWKALFSTPPEVGSEYCLELTIHKAWDLRKADWIGHNDVYAQVYRVDTTQQPINLSRALPKPDKKYKLPKGKTVYPFCFAIRTDAPGSAELPVYDYGYIRYDIYANVDKAFWRDPSRKRVITVVPNRPVPLPALLKGPVQRTLPEQLVHGMECCGCKCGRLDGLVSARLELDRQSYAAGEVMTVRGNVASTIAQPLSVALVLTMYVSMYTMRGMTNFGKKEIVVWSDTLPANTTMTLEQLVGGKTLRMPHTYPSFGGGAETPQMAKQSATRQLKRHYACLRWTYTLGLHVSKNLNGGGGIQAGIPVLVAAAPPYANAIVTESSPREVGSSAPEDVLAQALSTRENSTTTPRLTGPEDGGVVVRPDGLTNMITTFEVGDDSGAVGGSNPPYFPMVHAVTLDSGSTHPTLPVVSATAEVQVSGHFDTLLESLDHSLDRRLTVGEWVRDNPSAAALLTPSQVGQILSKVSFSLDQPSVAAEIAAGLEPTTSLTCEHVKEAMLACKYAKADVAKAMVASVRDPENKNVVLDLIEYSFERDDVDRAFVS